MVDIEGGLVTMKSKRTKNTEVTTHVSHLRTVDDLEYDAVVESFSRGFEEDLRKILGEAYHERPKQKRSAISFKILHGPSRESVYRSRR